MTEQDESPAETGEQWRARQDAEQRRRDRDRIAESVLPGLLGAGVWNAETASLAPPLHVEGGCITFTVGQYAEQIAGLAYELADAMLAQRKEQ